MVTNTDLIPLPFTPDLVSAGVRYALRALLTSAAPTEAARLAPLRQAVAQAIVELSLVRYLTAEDTPFGTLADAPFTDPQHAGLVLGGHRCQVAAHLVTHPAEAERARRGDKRFLAATRLDLPGDHLPDAWEADDLLIAAALSAHLLPTLAETRAAWRALQPIHLVYTLPLEWISPRRWADPGALTLVSGCTLPLEVELEGLDGDHQPLSETVQLAPGERQAANGRFFALAALQIFQAPDGPLGLRCSGGLPPVAGRQACTVQPRQWANLWFYDAAITLLGYQRRAELRRGLLLSELQPWASCQESKTMG